MTLLIVTIISLSIAAGMSVLTWRMAAAERRRSEARVALLSADIHARERPHRTESPAGQRLFEVVQPAPQASRLAVALTAGVLVVGAAATIVLIGGSAAPSDSDQSKRQTSTAAPLELVALTQERDADRLTVHGIVRSPGGASSTPDLTAVVLLFSRDGAFITSGRAEVNGATLEAGHEATFVVTIPGAAEASRYRVSFRTGDRVVPHVDRREGTTS